MTVVLGVDSSLTSTGLAWLNATNPAEPEWITRRVLSKPPEDGHDLFARARRIRRIAKTVAEFPGDVEGPLCGADVIVLEGVAFASKTAYAREIAALWWRTVDELAVALPAARLVVVPPASRAKYATGSGRADKHEVLAAVRETYPAADVPQHDVADAVALAAIGARIDGFPVEQVARPWVMDVAEQVARRAMEKEQG